MEKLNTSSASELLQRFYDSVPENVPQLQKKDLVQAFIRKPLQSAKQKRSLDVYSTKPLVDDEPFIQRSLSERPQQMTMENRKAVYKPNILQQYLSSIQYAGYQPAQQTFITGINNKSWKQVAESLETMRVSIDKVFGFLQERYEINGDTKLMLCLHLLQLVKLNDLIDAFEKLIDDISADSHILLYNKCVFQTAIAYIYHQFKSRNQFEVLKVRQKFFERKVAQVLTITDQGFYSCVLSDFQKAKARVSMYYLKEKEVSYRCNDNILCLVVCDHEYNFIFQSKEEALYFLQQLEGQMKCV